jgi:hypothetical protein
MDRVSNDPGGVVLLCHECSHAEVIDSFSKTIGSRRIQAVRAMQNHSRNEHDAGSVLMPIPKRLPSCEAHNLALAQRNHGHAAAGVVLYPR